ncbi:MAG: putative lipoprotein [Holophagaceae bacterium]|nr:putative lipoprotein [Holophagaceae bacterium]
MHFARPVLLALLGVAAAQAAAPTKAVIQRGAYLVGVGGCNDCHTPLKMGPKGPEPDMTRMLSGHPEALKMPPAPKLPEGPWMVTMAGSATAFAGPWGVSYAANLTSDKQTGLGGWTEAQFLQMVRTGRHLGQGRPILPPMPVPSLKAMTESDLKAVFAYLQTVPAVANRVPAATEPAPSSIPMH